MLLGAIAAVPSYFGLIIRAKTSLDDSLDVVAAHGVGGTVGALLTGVFADKSLNGLFDGALYGNPAQVGIQAAAVGGGHRLQRRGELRPAEADRPGHAAARDRRRRERRASTSRSTAKKPTCTEQAVSDRRAWLDTPRRCSGRPAPSKARLAACLAPLSRSGGAIRELS